MLNSQEVFTLLLTVSKYPNYFTFLGGIPTSLHCEEVSRLCYTVKKYPDINVKEVPSEGGIDTKDSRKLSVPQRNKSKV